MPVYYMGRLSGRSLCHGNGTVIGPGVVEQFIPVDEADGSVMLNSGRVAVA